MIEIMKLSDVKTSDLDLVQHEIEEIFFLSTPIKSFESIEKKQAFFNRWCGIYQTHYKEEFFLAMKEGKVLGYLSGCIDSEKATALINVKSYSVFSDYFLEFPAHLHINFHPDSRGLGLGSLLVNHYKDHLKSHNVRGVHIITSIEAQNVGFYARLGFTETRTRTYNDMPLYFMGCKTVSE